jgi:peptidoglycan/xylan/chitin deacetylase (PgdA/CDA1 family)
MRLNRGVGSIINPDRVPGAYSALKPFRSLFATGNPILIYHKLGPRPARVRLKGLYLSGRLFRRQLNELRTAGFQSGLLEECAGPVQAARIVLTFDDGYVNVMKHGLEALTAAGFKAIQFLPASFLGKRNEWDLPSGEAPEPIMDVHQVREWLAAGNDLGSHTLSHPFLTRIPIREAREEIAGSRRKLEDLFGRQVAHFCYPYGDYNMAVRDMVQEAGYFTACTTLTGVNTKKVSPFELRRILARYPTRSFRALGQKLITAWRARR